MGFDINFIFPIITTTFSLFFFLSVMEQYFRKHRPHQLVWGIAMALFMLTAGMEGFSMIYGRWIPGVFRVYYVLAAVQVSFMGGGVLYLFDSRNVINERNTYKQFLLFGIPWAFFSLIFSGRSVLFTVLLIPSIALIGLGIAYMVAKFIDMRRFSDQSEYLCEWCRTIYDHEFDTCENCNKKMMKRVTPSSSFRSWWHQIFTGRFFSHYFLGFSVLIFLMMTILAMTSPLYHGLLVTGKEVSGLPWQADPNNLNEPRAVVRLFSPLETVPGAIALVGGGFFSYVTWQLSIRRNTGNFQPKTGFYNVWIAVGALALASGAFFSGFGLGTLYFSEVISVAMMYWGFLGSDKESKEKIMNLISFRSKPDAAQISHGD